MPRAVRYDQYGSLDVLHVVEVDVPVPAAGEVVVEVVSAGINPGEVPDARGSRTASGRPRFPPGRAATSPGASSRWAARCPLPRWARR